MTAAGFDLNKTIAEQHRASRPDHSAWVRANAGSGKTHVLAQRVIRLLLNGVPPAKILCLTFTKAAAANMSLRIFETLARWTVLDDEQLRAQITATGAPIPQDLDDARRLFVRTVETPGGLKVQTIHAFCERLLHLFPFEANVGARFEAIDEETQRALLDEAQLRVLNNDVVDSDGRIADALALVAGEAGDQTFTALLNVAVRKHDALELAQRLQSNGLRQELGTRLGLLRGENQVLLVEQVLNAGLRDGDRDDIIAALQAGSSEDGKLSANLSAVKQIEDDQERADAYIACFFTNEGKPRSRLGTKKIPQAIRDQLRMEQERLIILRDKLRAAGTVERSCALYVLGDAVRSQYAAFKNVRGFLDFDDLIERTATLLGRYDTSWVLYKLDAGINHVLVDEAQDTSPVQWSILKKLTEEFFAGEGSGRSDRTFFAVGDEKQSIFSFQGAAPHEFGYNLASFQTKVESANMGFENVELKVSFRSSQIILDHVNTIFGLEDNRKGLTVNDDVAPFHQAYKHQLPGFVELSPPVTREKADAPDSWLLPVDAIREEDPAAVMAQQVAAKIQALLDPQNRQGVHDNDGSLRPVAAGDIMILVRKRGPFFDAVIRALKERRVPVAGADRLNIMDHIAIMDLVAAGQAALLPDDDLTLACVLKSPLIGLDDDDLIALAPARSGSLYEALAGSPDPNHQKAAQRIDGWQHRARSQTPFEFYSCLLGAERGRNALLSRLGEEASDAIDEFLRLALDGNAPGSATLVQFLARLKDTGLEIKRDMEGAGDVVRVMTVHAAKGLEAKIVFLPDTCTKPGGGRAPSIVDIAKEGGGPDLFVWRKSRKDDPEALAPVLDDMERLEAEEHRRLLYVALTRAEERLYIGGFHGTGGLPDGAWYQMIQNAFTPDGTAGADTGEPFTAGTEVRLADLPVSSAPKQAEPVPPWLWQKAVPEHSPVPPVRPSTALDSADQGASDLTAIPDGNREDAAGLVGASIGRLVHELLYRLPSLPSADRGEAARRYLAARATGLVPALQARIASDVLKILEAPEFAIIFGPDSRAEVAIAGVLTGGKGNVINISGQVDRLCVTDSDVWLVDFKTGRGRTVDETPQAYVRQMALYRAVLEPLFPGKPVRAMVVWTGGPLLVELPSDGLDRELSAVTSA